jgi:hypothetical protein
MLSSADKMPVIEKNIIKKILVFFKKLREITCMI